MARKATRRSTAKQAEGAEPDGASTSTDIDSESELDDATKAAAVYKDAVNLPAHQTKHLSELVYRLPRIDTAFRLLQRNDTNSTGSSLWLSSQVLSAFLLHTYAKPQLRSGSNVKRKRMLELGSGTGLLSLLMARLGWDVVATDIEPVLDSVLRPNIDSGLYQLVHEGHADPEQIRVCKLDWTAAEEPKTESLRGAISGNDSIKSSGDSSEPHLDLIVTADTIYEPGLIRPLLSTISHFYRRQTDTKPTILLALERRDPAHIDHALQIARDEFNLPLKQIPAKRVRKIFDTLGDGTTWSRDDWSGVEIWNL
ncbi:uncharacterized protein PAN0_058c6502 [Moesziomyces antarcticus]|uniref:Uncharacterized protein n=2 Tax=Pseudozyma antarctica TaxID=84753 RepID=A0A081CNL5_PSEA2|nr:uncharacterized protein PAN0_058c6502 [Moesziomyces antarcticus]GAK68261.1 conserved hypothetical protein [Moesziomyces antarcticus]SPO47328.1 uncharacterized protein PSANT_05016 [Moesziomyces antarcticus]